MKYLIRELLRNFGMDICLYPSSHERLLHELFKRNNISTIIDVGANTGQYAMRKRNGGFSGKIISFEPLSEAYTKLEHAAKNQLNWVTLNMALGDFDGASEINKSGNSTSSSLLSMQNKHYENAPTSKYIGKETIQVSRLDTIYDDYLKPEEIYHLKIDTQGFEDKVIKGALKVMPQVRGLELEMSLAELYEGQMLFKELLSYVEDLGFYPFDFQRGFYDKTNLQMLQINALFFKLN